MRKINQYDIIKAKHQEEFDKFPMAFAITEEDEKNGLKKLGLKETDKDKVTNIGAGGFIRDTDVEAFNEMMRRHKKEINDLIAADVTGENFIKDMFASELSNHEYGYTYELEETLASLDLTIEKINNNKNLQNGLSLALKPYHTEENEETEEEER